MRYRKFPRLLLQRFSLLASMRTEQLMPIQSSCQLPTSRLDTGTYLVRRHHPPPSTLQDAETGHFLGSSFSWPQTHESDNDLGPIVQGGSTAPQRRSGSRRPGSLVTLRLAERDLISGR